MLCNDWLVFGTKVTTEVCHRDYVTVGLLYMHDMINLPLNN